jgi:hypothetical protein
VSVPFGIAHYRGLYRLYPTNATDSKPFTFDDAIIIVRGAEFFVDGDLVFPPDSHVVPESPVRHLFGPTFHHPSVVYANNNHNYSLCLRRLTRVRENNLTLHRQLEANQHQFVYQHRHYYLALTEFVLANYPHCASFYDSLFSTYADPHPKRLLRIRAMRSLFVDGGLVHELWTRQIDIEIKKFEYAKVGKCPRATADFSTPASMLGYGITSYIKQAMSNQPFYFLDGEVHFVYSASADLVTLAFRRLISCPLRFCYLIFSDDACASFRTSRGIIRFNLDISSCDGSHRAPIFECVKMITPALHQPIINALIRQLELPVRVRSRSDRSRATLHFPGPRLFSGSTLTTLVNNVANFSLCLSLASHPDLSFDLIPELCAKSGYLVTVDQVHKPEDFQFLKCSPVIDVHGRYHAVLNFGVFLRAFGASKNELPGRGSWQQRARAFNSGLIRSFFVDDEVAIADLFRKKFPIQITPKLQALADSHFAFKLSAPSSPRQFHLSDYFARYNSTSADVCSFMSVFANSEPGDVIDHPYSWSCIAKDYGW